MKQLIRAKELYDEIVKLDYQIAEINQGLDIAVHAKQEYLISCTRKAVPKPQQPKMVHIPGGFDGLAEAMRNLHQDLANEVSHNDELHIEVVDTELLIMFSALLDYKKAKRQQLVEHFNQLNISLKI